MNNIKNTAFISLISPYQNRNSFLRALREELSLQLQVQETLGTPQGVHFEVLALSQSVQPACPAAQSPVYAFKAEAISLCHLQLRQRQEGQRGRPRQESPQERVDQR